MKRSAATSRSAVVTPGRTLDSTSLSVLTRIPPAAAILAISSGLFLMITTPAPRRAARRTSRAPSRQPLLQSQRGQRRPYVGVDLGRGAGAVEAAQGPTLVVVLLQRAGGLVVDAEPAHDRLGLVVVALLERRP